MHTTILDPKELKYMIPLGVYPSLCAYFNKVNIIICIIRPGMIENIPFEQANSYCD